MNRRLRVKMSSSVAGKVWGVIIVQDRSNASQTQGSPKYLFLQEKLDQPYTIPCYDVTTVSDVKNHLEKTFAKVIYTSVFMHMVT